MGDHRVEWSRSWKVNPEPSKVVTSAARSSCWWVASDSKGRSRTGGIVRAHVAVRLDDEGGRTHRTSLPSPSGRSLRTDTSERRLVSRLEHLHLGARLPQRALEL